jgi:hypothetical protein
MTKSLIISLIIGALTIAAVFLFQALSKRGLRRSFFYAYVLGALIVMIAVVQLAEWTIPG